MRPELALLRRAVARAIVAAGALALLRGEAAAQAPRPAPGDTTATPAAIVDALTAAFDARDLDRFVAYFADSLEIIDLGTGRVGLRGRAAFRASHAPRFAAQPAARVALLQRIVHGAYVVDRERVDPSAAERGREGTVILEVRGGRVTRLWSLPD